MVVRCVRCVWWDMTASESGHGIWSIKGHRTLVFLKFDMRHRDSSLRPKYFTQVASVFTLSACNKNM